MQHEGFRNALHHPGRIYSSRKSLKRDRQSVFFTAAWTRCTPIKIWKKFSTIWTNPELRCTRIFGEFTKIQFFLVQSEARSKNRIAVLSNSIARNRSFQHTTCDLVLRKWYTWRLERIYTAKDINPQGYRASYSRHICNMDPPTITANKACGSGKLVAHFSRTHVASIPEKVSDGSTGTPVAVTLITEFQVYFTQPSRKKTLIARKPSKDWFNSSRITRTGTR